MSAVYSKPDPALAALRRQWIGVAIAWAAVWAGTFILLRPVWPLSGRWALSAAVVLAYELWVLWRHLPLNHRVGETALLPTLGAGNLLSLFRGLCIGLLAGFLFGPWPMGALAWGLVLLYTAADIADYFDGYLARRADHVTPLGGQLDIEFDGLGTLVVILLAVSFGQLPGWYLVLGLARYLFLAGLWWRERRGLPIGDLPPSVHRRIFAGFQMGFLSVVLWPIVPASMATIAGTIFAAATGGGFLRDWLVISGRIDPANPTYRRAQSAAFRLLSRILPLVWRALLVVTMVSMFRALGSFAPPTAWAAELAILRFPAPGAVATISAVFAILGGVLIAAGVAGRVLAIPMTFPIGVDISARGLQPDNAVALVSIVFLALLGTGLYSLWKPEQPLIHRRLGER